MKQLAKRCLALLMAIVMCFGLIPVLGGHAHAAEASGEWKMVTNVNDLKVDDQIVIVATGYNYAMSTTQNTNNRAQAAVTKSGDTVTFGSDVQIITLKEGKTTGTFAFYTGSKGYLYAASSSSNHLKTTTTLDARGSWNISIDPSGVATVKAAQNSRNWMRYNATNNPPIFSCYGSGQTDIAIYKYTCAHANTEVKNAVKATCIASGYEGDTYCNDCKTTIEVGSTINALGHDYGEDGKCIRCGSDEECTHENTTKLDAVDPTCTESGLTAGEVCICGHIVKAQEEVPATGHVNTNKLDAVAPTCTTSGLTEGEECVACGHKVVPQEKVAATGHSFEDGVCGKCGLSGKNVKIYYPASNLYVTSTASGNKLAGGDASKAAVWQMIVDEQGYVSFFIDGKYLTSGTTGNSLSLVEGLTDLGRWVVEEASGGVYLRNVGANYNGKYNQYLEYYSGFTTYSFDSAKANIYTFELQCIHDSIEKLDAEDPTCTETGLTEGEQCRNCGEIVKPQKTVDVIPHTYGEGVVTESTCTEKGYTTYTCTVCGGGSYTDNETELKEHTYGEDRKCTVCGAEKDCAHADTTDLIGTPATCTETGLTDGKQCNECKKILVEQEVIPATGHKYNEGVVTKPTCTEAGYTTYTCENGECTDSYTADEVAALNHDMADATCKAPATCKRDGCTHTVGEPADHNYVDGICSGCGAEEPSTVTASVSIADYAKDHNWVKGTAYLTVNVDKVVTVTASSGTNNGKYYDSNNSWRMYQSDKGTIVVSAGGKTIDSVKITYTPDDGGILLYNGAKVESGAVVTVNGTSATFSASSTSGNGGKVQITAIEVVYLAVACKHTNTTKLEAVAPNCTESGLTEGAKCADCGETVKAQEVIPANGHKHEAVVTDPTCTEDGYTTYTCSVCNDTYTGNVVKAPGHIYENGVCTGCGIEKCAHTNKETVPGKAATCTESGLTDGEKCADCQEILKAQEVIPALGHNWVNGECTVCHQVKLTYVTSQQGYIYNWGTREEEATFLSPNAEAFYAGQNTYEYFSELAGGTGASDAPDSDLYEALKSFMSGKHTWITSYDDTKVLYQYTDCENSGDPKTISSFYSGVAIGPAWDGGSTWNREHTWPNSKGDASGQGENDIMMLRPASMVENSTRGNKAYGESSGFYNPNGESNGKHDLRGDVSRIMLYVYVRWGNTGSMWGSDGVIESLDVLLRWMEEDPVDTWELGRNDSVESMTGTRNVFVDYPELAFLLFGEDIPADMTTPSGEAQKTDTCNHNYVAGDTVAPTCTSRGYTVYTCSSCQKTTKKDYVDMLDHNYVDGKCTVCQAVEVIVPVYVTEVATGTAYKLGLFSTDKSNTYYFTGTMVNTYYGATDSDYDKGVDMYLETASGGYYLYFVNASGAKQYINLVANGTYLNFTISAAAGSVYTWDADRDALCTTVGSEKCYIGNYGTYTSLNVLSTSKLKDTDYIARLYTIGGGSGETPEPPVACEHTNTEVIPGKAATCTETGLTEGKKCSDCGTVLVAQTTIPATGHNYVDGTCTGCGQDKPTGTQATITFDDTGKRTEISDDKQVWVENGITIINEKAASKNPINGEYYKPIRLYQGTSLTIEYPGMTRIEFVCNNYKDYTSALQASVTEGTVTISGDVVTITLDTAVDTYNIAGFTAQVRVDSITIYGSGSGETPSACEHTNTETIPGKAATCTETGLTEGKKCSDCGTVLVAQTEIPVIDHTYVAGTPVDPTCTAEGYTTYTCGVCGHSYNGDKVPAVGHTYVAGTPVAPTCTEEGYTTYTCDVCGDSYKGDKVPTIEHNYVDGKCTECGADEHNWIAATCTTPKTCADCGVTEGEALGHSFALHSHTNATCVNNGMATYACGACGVMYSTVINATGHKMVDGICAICGVGVTTTDETVTVVITDKVETDEVVVLPIPEVTVSNSEAAPTITIDLSNNKTESAIKVEIPVAEVKASTVIVIVHEDGTEEIVQKTALTEKGLVFEAEENVSVKVIDNSKEFVDVDPEGWSSKAIDFASSREILNGMGNDVFSPKTNMTRGQLAVMLYNLESKPEVDLNSTFTDANGTWYTEAVEWAAAEKIVMGNTDGTFGGEKDMTREQMVTFLYRYAGSPKVTNSTKFNSFNDCASVSSWAVEAMSWAIEMGIINGVGNNTIDPSGTATREQVAQILMNFLNAQ